MYLEDSGNRPPCGVFAGRKMSVDRVRRRPRRLRIGSAHEGQDSKRARHLPS